MKLYHSPGSCALASLITLNEANAEFEAVHVDFKKGEQQSEEFLAINPKGRVPALVTERGILTETPAILFFIAQTLPESGLAPLDDPFELAKAQSFNSYLCSTVHVNHAHGLRGTRWADQQASLDDMAAKVPETMGGALDLVENDYLKGPWVLGENYSICDAYLFTIARWLERDRVPADRHPRIHEHMQRVGARPAVRAALETSGLS